MSFVKSRVAYYLTLWVRIGYMGGCHEKTCFFSDYFDAINGMFK